MGQIEVYEFLKNRLVIGDNAFYSCKAIERALKEGGCSAGIIKGVRGDLLRLELSGYLEARIDPKPWVRCWRLKLKYARCVS